MYLIPRATFVDFNAQLPTERRLTKVGFENGTGGWDTVCTAYVSEFDRWNGWAKPEVDRANLQTFLQYQADLKDKHAADVSTGRLEGDTLVMFHPGEHEGDGAHERIEPHTICFEGRDIQVWQISLGLTWDEIDEPAVRQDRPAPADHLVGIANYLRAERNLYADVEYPGYIAVQAPIWTGQGTRVHPGDRKEIIAFGFASGTFGWNYEETDRGGDSGLPPTTPVPELIEYIERILRLEDFLPNQP